MKLWLCVVVLCVTAVLADDEWREVTIAQGPVRGRKHPNGDLYAFYNIPYATGPEGENKYKVLSSDFIYALMYNASFHPRLRPRGIRFPWECRDEN